MSVCPAPRRGRRALSALSLLLLCLLAGAGCAARGRSAAVPTATGPLAPPTSTPTFTPTPTVPSPATGPVHFQPHWGVRKPYTLQQLLVYVPKNWRIPRLPRSD